MTAPVLFWFRQDLRLADNPGLALALASGHPVLPVYILDDETPGPWRIGAAARWWLHHSLAALERSLADRGAPLILRRGGAAAALDALIDEAGAAGVFWNRCYEPSAVARDKAIKAALLARGLRVESANASLLAEPWTVANQSGQPYRVFTPYWRALRARPPVVPIAAPTSIAAPARRPPSAMLADWRLTPQAPDWAGGLRESWQPGEAGARARVAAFLAAGLLDYDATRNRPEPGGTSQLSPHLHWGEIGPRQVWHAALAAAAAAGREAAAEPFLRQLGWREFSHQLLWHWPDLPTAPWRPSFAAFPWSGGTDELVRWQRGRTGFPIVDAGMRQLWHTGWMHNRVRMIAASFLVKDLLVPWQRGAAWFWDTLVDADLANNAASWQWVAGSGADAAPYFRIFNPVSQGEKFDPSGAYVRRWLPELAGLPDRFVHRPWEAPADLLAAAGVAIGRTYPAPMVDHAEARVRALAAYRGMGAADG
jgi:deoxyribodipyrimidine photo-lyase